MVYIYMRAGEKNRAGVHLISFSPPCALSLFIFLLVGQKFVLPTERAGDIYSRRWRGGWRERAATGGGGGGSVDKSIRIRQRRILYRGGSAREGGAIAFARGIVGNKERIFAYEKW